MPLATMDATLREQFVKGERAFGLQMSRQLPAVMEGLQARVKVILELNPTLFDEPRGDENVAPQNRNAP